MGIQSIGWLNINFVSAVKFEAREREEESEH
jgi:hypothetical protein